MPLTVEMGIAKYKLDEDPLNIAEHWAAYFDFGDGELYFAEIAGASKGSIGSLNQVNYHNNSTKYTDMVESETKEYPESKNSFKQRVQVWAAEWISNHRFYDVHGSNCQQFVRDFLRDFDCCDQLKTQHEECGEFAIGLGTIFTGVGMLLGAVGIWAASRHKDKPRKEDENEN